MIGPEPELSILDVLRLVWARRRWVLGGTLLFAGVGVALALLQPSVYRAQTTIVASSQLESGSSGMTGLTGAARQFGIDLGTGNSEPSALFGPILQSRTLAENLVGQRFNFGRGEEVLLADYLAPDVEEEDRLRAALGTFRKKVLRSSLSLESGVLTISVILENPQAAAAVANACVEELDRLNRAARNAQAAEWVQYLDEQLGAIEQRLRDSEETLKSFHQENRSIARSPQLMMEEARRSREVELNQELFISMKTQAEMAKAKAAKNVPVLTVLDGAVAPHERYRPQRALLVVLATVFGFAIIVVFLLLSHFLRGLSRALKEPAAPARQDEPRVLA